MNFDYARIGMNFGMDYSEFAKKMYKHAGDRTIVFTNGCFDLFHPGHLNLLNYARAAAGSDGWVVVGINDDESVTRLKGPSRPIVPLDSRVNMLLSQRSVDWVISFSEDTPLNLIKALRPDVIVKGDEYKVSEVVGKEYAASGVQLVKRTSEWSTSSIIQKIKKL